MLPAVSITRRRGGMGASISPGCRADRDVEGADAIVLVAMDPTEELPVLWRACAGAVRAGAAPSW
jgi:hypothetical protein